MEIIKLTIKVFVVRNIDLCSTTKMCTTVISTQKKKKNLREKNLGCTETDLFTRWIGA